MKKKIKCRICKKYFKSISNTHLKQHKLTQKQYKNKYNHILYSEKTRYLSSISLKKILRTKEWNEKNSKAKIRYYSEPKNREKTRKQRKNKSYEEIYGKKGAKKLKKQQRKKMKKEIGEKSRAYKNGISIYRKQKLKDSKKICEKCSNTKQIIIHHIDKNRENNDLKNLMILCRSCHNKIHAKICENCNCNLGLKGKLFFKSNKKICKNCYVVIQ